MAPRTFLLAAAVAGGVAVAVSTWWPDPGPPPAEPARARRTLLPERGFTVGRAARGDQSAARPSARSTPGVEQRLRRLERKLAVEVARRRQLEEQIEALSGAGQADAGSAAQNAEAGQQAVALSDRRRDEEAVRQSGRRQRPPAAQPPAAPAAVGHAAAATDQAPAPQGPMATALSAAGLDPETVDEIKRDSDRVALAEVNLRARAAREGWHDTPRFDDELAAIEAQQTPLREQLGDDAYDAYMYARGRPNRVRIDDVMMDSPAEAAGLLPNDMVTRYGSSRIFSTRDLIDESRNSDPRDVVEVEVVRNGETFVLEVPGGPLGLRIIPLREVPLAYP